MRDSLLAFLKPDAVIRRYVGARVITQLVEAGFELRHFCEVRESQEFFATEHYAEHREKFFFDWLIRYVTSGPLIAFELDGENAIQRVRSILGATVPERADGATLRGRYGVWGGINVAHASDGKENAKRELELWQDVLGRGEDGSPEVAREYARSYLDFPMIDVTRYREISESLASRPELKGQAVATFERLLRKESDSDEKTISQFALVMVDNALLRMMVGSR